MRMMRHSVLRFITSAVVAALGLSFTAFANPDLTDLSPQEALIAAEEAALAEDFATAFAAYTFACDGGEAEGCYRVGQYHKQGLVDAADPASARTFYQLACDSDYADGCGALSTMYYRGEAGPKDLTRARALNLRACDLGDAIACRIAGLMARDGEGGPVDREEAARLFEKRCAILKTRNCDASLD